MLVAVRLAPVVASLLGALMLASCATAGIDLSSAEVDDTITTASVPADPAKVSDSVRASDEVTIRNAVTSVDLDQVGGAGLSWANADTGSRGAVTELAEQRRKGVLCRTFKASRESYDGVAVFRGETCLGGAGWRLMRFDEI